MLADPIHEFACLRVGPAAGVLGEALHPVEEVVFALEEVCLDPLIWGRELGGGVVPRPVSSAMNRLTRGIWSALRSGSIW